MKIIIIMIHGKTPAINNLEIERSTFQSKKKLNRKKNDLVDDIENLKNDLNIEVEKDLLPSSFSLSFLINPSLADNLRFEFTGGFYEKTNNEILYKNKGEQKKGREWFFRSPLRCSGLISLNDKDDDLLAKCAEWFGFPSDQKWRAIRYTFYAMLGGYLLGEAGDKLTYLFHLKDNPFWDS